MYGNQLTNDFNLRDDREHSGMPMKKFTIAYSICDYSGETTVYADENIEHDQLAAKTERQLARGCPFPIGYRSFKVLKIEDIDD